MIIPSPSHGWSLMALVRHGQTSWNRDARIQGRTDVGLSEAGRREIVVLAEELRAERWDAIVSSPLHRAVESAQILARALGCDITKDAGLIERDYGLAEGMSVADAKRFYPIDSEASGSEPSADVARRGVAAIARIAQDHLGGRVIVVSHGALLAESLRRLNLDGEAYIATGSCRLVLYDGSEFGHPTR